MKTKHVLLLVLVALCRSAFAQPPLELGQAVTTNSCFSSNEQAVKIFDVRDPSTATLGENWGLGNNTYPNWTAQNLGQVFGIAIDPINPDHIIYISTTQIYQQHNNFTYNSGYKPFPTPTPGNTAVIWRLNAATGSATPLIRSQVSPTFSSTHIFNRGTGMGNICFDKIHGLMYATNMEDGRIYCINPNTNAVISRYDPFGSFPISGGNIPEFAPLGQRLWGIGVSANKVYFAVWREDAGNQSATDKNAVYSVDIDPATGQFVPTGSGGHTGNDYYDPTPNLEFEMPMIRFDHAAYSPPVSDIEFSLDGTQMWLAERTMSGPTMGVFNGSFDGWAHESRVLRYDLVGTSWVQSSNIYHIGNSANNTNCTGGVDLGYKVLDPNGVDVCEEIVYATGDALKFDDGAAYGTDKYIYGFTGVPVGGNDGFDPSGTNPNAVNVSSIYQDLFGNFTDLPHSKSQPGDIDIYREACNCDVADAQITLDTNIVVEPTVLCVGDTTTVFVKSDAPFGRYFVEAANGTHYQSAVFSNPIGSWFAIQVPIPNGGYIGTNHVCFSSYSANPDETDVWCSASACLDIEVRNCKCDTMVVVANVTTSDDSVCVGQEVTFTISGPGWAKMWFDTEDDPELVEVPAGGLSQTGIPPVDALGTHTLCVILYTANPLETNEWCSDTFCTQLEVINCGCDSLLGNAAIAKSHLGPMHYDFWDAYADDFEPTFINWYVDGDQKKQTPGDGHFDWEFTPGDFIVCMQVGYILPGQNGTNECCYDWVCDTIHIDSCDYWKDNNGLTVTVDPFDYRKVTFTYTQDFGANPHTPVVVFEFGDGQTEVNDGSVPVVHHYNYTGSIDYCVYVVWSLHDRPWSPDTPSVCCCVDTICSTIDIKPCNADSFEITFVTDPIDGTTHLHAETNGGGMATMYEWTIDGVLQGTTASPDMNYPGDGGVHTVCLRVTYNVTFPKEITYLCDREFCTEMVLDGSPQMRLGAIVRYFPNPTNTSVTVEVSANAGDKCIVELVDYLGRPAITRKFENLHDGSNMLYLNVAALTKGFYSMKVTVAENSSVVKLLKK